MSYILDALKKSDQERQQETPLHLQQLYETSPSFRTGGLGGKQRWPLLFLFGALLSGGLMMWLGWKPWIDLNRQESAGEALPQSSPAGAETAARQESAGQASMPAAAVDGRTLSPLTIQEEWFDEWVEHLPKNDFSLPSVESPPLGEVEQEDSPPVVLTAAQSKINTLLKITRDREKVVLAPQDGTTVISPPQPVEPVEQPGPPVVIRPPGPVPSVVRSPEPVPSIVRPPEPASSVGAGPPSLPPEKSGSDLPYLQDLPPRVQAEIPKLQFAGHAYALMPSQRLIVINGAIMREGDQIDAETRLAEITWEGVIIERKGVRFQVKCY